jgi:hypothetical protein
MAASDNLSEQLQLFDPGPAKEPETDHYDPANWAQSDATVWHSTLKKGSPHQTADIGMYGDYSGFHVGSRRSADEATRYSRRRRDRSYPYRMTGSSALNPTFGEYQTDQTTWRDDDANDHYNYSDMHRPNSAHNANARGEHVPYLNEMEDSGSVSFRAAPENLMTWSEHVMSDPKSPAHWREKAQTHELVAHVGKPLYKRSERNNTNNVQFPLPGMEHLGPTKMTVDRPSLPPDAEIAHVFDDTYTDRVSTVEHSTEVETSPQHRYLVFEPKKGRRKGK